MARFLTPEWVAELNATLQGSPPDFGAGEPAIPEGRVTVVELVRGAPEGDLALVMRIEPGSVHLTLAHPGAGGEDGDRPPGAGPADHPDVTISVSYADAEALARGSLTPAEALAAGRVRVRGDLTALAAAQQVLGTARSGTGGIAPDPT